MDHHLLNRHHAVLRLATRDWDYKLLFTFARRFIPQRDHIQIQILIIVFDPSVCRGETLFFKQPTASVSSPDFSLFLSDKLSETPHTLTVAVAMETMPRRSHPSDFAWAHERVRRPVVCLCVFVFKCAVTQHFTAVTSEGVVVVCETSFAFVTPPPPPSRQHGFHPSIKRRPLTPQVSGRLSRCVTRCVELLPFCFSG